MFAYFHFYLWIAGISRKTSRVNEDTFLRRNKNGRLSEFPTFKDIEAKKNTFQKIKESQNNEHLQVPNITSRGKCHLRSKVGFMKESFLPVTGKMQTNLNKII